MNSLFNFECYFFNFIADNLHKISNPVSCEKKKKKKKKKNVVC